MRAYASGALPGSVSRLGGSPVMSGERVTVDVSALYAAHRVSLVRLAILFVDDQNSAEDVVQDAFVGLHRHRDRIRDPAAAVGYLRTAVVNGSRSALRRRRTVREHAGLAAPQFGAGADAGLLIADQDRAVLAAIRLLPPRQQEVVMLRYWSDLSEAEIAEALGISRGAVKSNASRALDKLERALRGSR